MSAGEPTSGANLRSPLAKVLGLGSAKGAAAHWWTQRLTSVALIPLTLWFLFALLSLGSLDYDVVRSWLALPYNTVGALLLIFALAYHSQLGIQVVVEDYVHHHGLKLVTLVLVNFAHWVVAALGVFAVLKIAFGVVP